VRRLLAAGLRSSSVRGTKGPAGAISNASSVALLADASAAGRVARRLPTDVRDLLTTIGPDRRRARRPAFLVGGIVRDLWRGATIERRDLDVVVEGDGPTVARRLARAVGGSVVEHRRFLTASIETRAFGRIDVADVALGALRGSRRAAPRDAGDHRRGPPAARFHGERHGDRARVG
jgi:hypothetical protein